MKFAVLFLLAAAALRFDITDARGKSASGVSIETGVADDDGWYSLKAAKAKADPVILWPFDARAKAPDGPGSIPAIVIQRGDEKVLKNPLAVAAMATPVALGLAGVPEVAQRTGLDAAALTKALSELPAATGPFEKGVGLLYAGKPAEAADELAKAFRERRRQLTRVPSEIYALALLDGHALMAAGKYDAAAVAYLEAVKLRPSDQTVRDARSAALVQAGKAEAAEKK